MSDHATVAESARRIPAPNIHHPAYDSAVGVIRRLVSAGHEAYIVGGGVRDLVLGDVPKDIDIVTSAKPEETQRLFRRSIPVGEKFGVVTVVENGHAFEVATFRADGAYSDGRRPDWVRFAGLREDIARRDFTINGLVLDPRVGEVLDYAGGVDDLNRGVIRTIGNPAERFAEDSLRLVRAARFAARLGFRIGHATRDALVESAHTVSRVAPERVFGEMERMLSDPRRASAVSLLADTGLLRHVIPEAEALRAGGSGPLGEWELSVRRLEALPAVCPTAVAWAAMLADVVIPEHSGTIEIDAIDVSGASEILGRLRPPRKLDRDVRFLLARRWVWRRATDMRTGRLRQILRHGPVQSLRMLWIADAESFGLGGRLELVEREIDLVRGRFAGGDESPPFTGDDLIAAGLQPGPGVGDALDEMEVLWLEEAFDEPGAAERWLRQKAETDGS